MAKSSPFITWLRGKMEERGMDQRALAQALSELNDRPIGETTIHNWMTEKNKPSVRAYILIGRLFGEPIHVVLQQAGFHTVPSGAEDERARRRAEVVARLPRYAQLAEKLASLPPAAQDAFLSRLEDLLGR